MSSAFLNGGCSSMMILDLAGLSLGTLILRGEDCEGFMRQMRLCQKACMDACALVRVCARFPETKNHMHSQEVALPSSPPCRSHDQDAGAGSQQRCPTQLSSKLLGCQAVVTSILLLTILSFHDASFSLFPLGCAAQPTWLICAPAMPKLLAPWDTSRDTSSTEEAAG